MAMAACGGGSSDTGSSGGSEPTQDLEKGGSAQGQLLPDVSGEAPPIEGATKGGTLTVNTAEAPSTFDPTQAYYTDSTGIMSNLVNRSLTQFRYNPDTKQMDLIPDMATDLGTSNKDQTEWTFELKPGLKYENGDPVKAEDIAYAIKRSFAVEELPYGPTYQLTFFKDGDTYKGPYKDGTNYSGVTVSGNKITIHMRKPFGDMPYYATFPLFTGIPEKADTDPTAYGRHPLATGPYMFESYKPGNQLVLVKNKYWDPATDPGRHQYVDKWIFNFGVDSTKLDNELINDNGDAQTSLTYQDILASDYPTADQAGVIDEGRLVTGTSPCTYMWNIDMRQITDIKVRQALGWAFPYEASWKALGKIKGLTRVPGTTILPPGMPGRVEYDPLGNGGIKTDPSKAKALLQEADAVGYEIKWYYEADTPELVAEMKTQKAALEAAGFKASPVASSSDTFRDDIADPNLKTNPTNVMELGWCSDWPSGASWFPAIAYGPLIKQNPTSHPNYWMLDDPKVNQMIEATNDLPIEKALPAWGDLDKYIEENIYPAVVIGYDGQAMLRGSRVGGMTEDNTRGMPVFSDMYVVPE
jgi:peptide/nickel transport system substrate-binding protein